MVIAVNSSMMSSTAGPALYALAGLLIGFWAGKVSGKGSGRTKTRRSGGKKSRGSRSRRPVSVSSSGLIEIYVGNMNYDMDETALREAFAKFGQVASARVIDNRRNGKSKGYGFVEMSDRAEAEAAINALNNKEVMGRRLRVNEARNKQRDD